MEAMDLCGWRGMKKTKKKPRAESLKTAFSDKHKQTRQLSADLSDPGMLAEGESDNILARGPSLQKLGHLIQEQSINENWDAACK